MVIDRNIISQNFSLKDTKTHSRQDLFDRIDVWKTILHTDIGVIKGSKIAIGITEINLEYFAIIFAALELGLKFLILDYSIKKDSWQNADYKSEAFGPIDLFLHEFPQTNDNYQYYSKRSKKTVHIDEHKHKCCVDNNVAAIRPTPDDDVLLCTSSGTTGTPKKVIHKHGFLYELVMRNKQFFSGTTMHIRNLHHGSSMAVYFLPSLASDDVTLHIGKGYNILTEGIMPVVKKAVENDIKNISFPYIWDAEQFFKDCEKNNYRFSNLCVYVLSYIPNNWQNYFDIGIEKITSIFGCNETSGPLLLNEMTKHDTHDPTIFYAPDEFYNLNFNNGMLSVGMPVYNTVVDMNDMFEIVGNRYVHIGRHDLIRINDKEINLKFVANLPLMSAVNGICVTDNIYNKIYYCFWQDYKNKEDIIKKANTKLKIEYGNRVQISDYAVLNKQDFLRGIKVDNELIRYYFRNKS